jgi:hypothetical protein
MSQKQRNIYEVAAERIALLRAIGFRSSASRKAVAALMDKAQAESWGYQKTVDAIADLYPEDDEDNA